MSIEELQLLRQILDHYGTREQLNKTREELRELDSVIAMMRENGPITNQRYQLAEEIADVENTLNSLKLAYCLFEKVDSIRLQKLERTIKRVEGNREGDK